MGVSENNIGIMPTTARPHRRDTGRNAGRRPYVSGGPKGFVRYVFWGQGPFSASGAIECRLREALRVKTWCLAPPRATQQTTQKPTSASPRTCRTAPVVSLRVEDVPRTSLSAGPRRATLIRQAAPSSRAKATIAKCAVRGGD